MKAAGVCLAVIQRFVVLEGVHPSEYDKNYCNSSSYAQKDISTFLPDVPNHQEDDKNRRSEKRYVPGEPAHVSRQEQCDDCTDGKHCCGAHHEGVHQRADEG